VPGKYHPFGRLEDTGRCTTTSTTRKPSNARATMAATDIAQQRDYIACGTARQSGRPFWPTPPHGVGRRSGMAAGFYRRSSADQPGWSSAAAFLRNAGARLPLLRSTIAGAHARGSFQVLDHPHLLPIAAPTRHSPSSAAGGGDEEDRACDGQNGADAVGDGVGQNVAQIGVRFHRAMIIRWCGDVSVAAIWPRALLWFPV